MKPFSPCTCGHRKAEHEWGEGKCDHCPCALFVPVRWWKCERCGWKSVVKAGLVGRVERHMGTAHRSDDWTWKTNEIQKAAQVLIQEAN